MGKPNHGSKIRAVGGGTAGAAKKGEPQSSRARAAHSLTASGCVAVAASAAFSESRPITLDFVRRSPADESGGNAYLSHVRLIYTDRAKDSDRDDYGEMTPCLAAIANDQLRRYIELEASQGDAKQLSPRPPGDTPKVRTLRFRRTATQEVGEWILFPKEGVSR